MKDLDIFATRILGAGADLDVRSIEAGGIYIRRENVR